MTQKLLTLPFRIGFGAARTALDISVKTLDISAKLAGSAIDMFWPGSSSEPDSQPATSASATKTPATGATATETPPAGAAATKTDAPATAPRTKRPPATRESRVNGHGAQSTAPAPPPPPSPPTPPEQQPDTPLTPRQDALKTLEDEEEIVAEFAEPGAEDGVGAQPNIEEPWEGYAKMSASTIIARIDQAGPAELAILELYEQAHKKRQTVLNAAAKRLLALSPPEAG